MLKKPRVGFDGLVLVVADVAGDEDGADGAADVEGHVVDIALGDADADDAGLAGDEGAEAAADEVRAPRGCRSRSRCCRGFRRR